MKPFNLEEALAGKAVMLRNGDKAYVRHHETEIHSAVKALVGYNQWGLCLAWCESGDCYGPDDPAGYDIIGMYPETRVINGFEVPPPETEPLEEGCTYFLAVPHAEGLYIRHTWGHRNTERLWLTRGLIFLCKEDAIANAKAALGVDPHSEHES